jgi:hypothetical protein
MKMRVRTVLLFLITLSVFTSCHTYEFTHSKSSDLDKMKLNKYKVYIFAKNRTYKVDKASLSPAGISGSLTPITDASEIDGVKRPTTKAEMRNHKSDLGIYTKNEVSDTTTGVVLKKADISDVTHVTVKSTGIGKKIGNTVAAVVVSAVGIAMIAGIVYSFQ